MKKKKTKKDKHYDPDLDFESVDLRDLRILSKEEVDKIFPWMKSKVKRTSTRIKRAA